MFKQAEDFRMEDDVKFSLKDLDLLFTSAGFELSKVQLNELYLELDAGRKFNYHKYRGWLKLNHAFIVKKTNVATLLLN